MDNIRVNRVKRVVPNVYYWELQCAGQNDEEWERLAVVQSIFSSLEEARKSRDFFIGRRPDLRFRILSVVEKRRRVRG